MAARVPRLPTAGPAAEAVGKSKLIFRATFPKPLERNIYISNPNISLLTGESCLPK